MMLTAFIGWIAGSTWGVLLIYYAQSTLGAFMPIMVSGTLFLLVTCFVLRPKLSEPHLSFQIML